MTKANVLKAAQEYEWDDADALVKAIAQEHTILNLGATVEEYIYGNVEPSRVISTAFHGMRQAYGSEGEELLDGIEDEYRSWVKNARKDVATIEKLGLPLTLANARRAFEGEFKKSRKK